MSFFGRLRKTNIKTLMAEQGPAAFLTYSAVSVASFGLWCGAAHYTGIDQKKLLGYLPFAAATSEAPAETAVAASTTPSQSLKLEQMAKEVVRDVRELGITQVQKAEHALKEGLEKAEHAVMEGLEMAETAVMESIDKAELAVSAMLNHQDTLPASSSTSSADFSKHGTVIAVAWVAHNVTFPVRLGLTAALTPYVASRIRGGYIDGLLKRYMSKLTPTASAATASAAGTTCAEANNTLRSKFIGIRK
ncbi:hypothetical protein BDR26DRAFT_870517 [Obelidium mucronatum]|nr:hypothetical protein BDR26DRAFT_870517 [Obelidium mucronatum]